MDQTKLAQQIFYLSEEIYMYIYIYIYICIHTHFELLLLKNTEAAALRCSTK